MATFLIHSGNVKTGDPVNFAGVEYTVTEIIKKVGSPAFTSTYVTVSTA